MSLAIEGITTRPLQPQELPRCAREQILLNYRFVPAGPYPGDDELPGILVVGVNSLPQQGDEAHQVKLVTFRHNVLWVKDM